MKVVILAGGKGTRLRPYTQLIPKPLMPLGDRSILEILIGQLRGAGIKEVILTVGHLSALIQTYFGQGEKLGVKIGYSHEKTPLGTAGPLSLIKALDETFFVTNGDVLCDIDFNDMIEYHKKNGGIATVAMFNREIKIDMGVIRILDGTNEIADYIEKPSYVYPVSMGVYIFEPQVLEYIPYNEYFDFPDLVLTMIKAGETVIGYPFMGYWRDLGSPLDYEQAARDFEEEPSRFITEESNK